MFRKVRTIFREDRNSKSEDRRFRAMTIAPFLTSLFITLLMSWFMILASEVRLIIPWVSALTKKGLLLIYSSTAEDIVFI